MPRTKISRDLGPLPQRSIRKSAHQKSENLFQVLRSLALKHQREHPRVFYSLREVADQFSVPVSSVSKVYCDLEREGLLSRVRGSKTFLQGRRYNRRLSVRAIVGLPILFSNFISSPDYRAFYNSVQSELWLRGFAPTALFCRPTEITDGSLIERANSYGSDIIIWLSPSRIAKESLLRLTDMGIRVITVNQFQTPGRPSRYQLWRERGMEALLREWKEGGAIRKVVVVRSKAYRSPVTEEVLLLVLEALGIEFEIRAFKEEVGRCLQSLCRDKGQGIILPNVTLASMISFQNPNKMAELLHSQRVAFVDGPIDLPTAKLATAPVDVVTFNWQNVAESIVNDLITLAAFDTTRHTTFHAEAHLRVKVSSFGDAIYSATNIGAPQ